jgi:putative endonuclease
MSRRYYVYIMSSKSGVLYIGSTNDLERRIFEHKHGLIEGFTKKYKVTRLVYVEEFGQAAEMIARERQLKGWSRNRKLDLIHDQNPAMLDYARSSRVNHTGNTQQNRRSHPRLQRAATQAHRPARGGRARSFHFVQDDCCMERFISYVCGWAGYAPFPHIALVVIAEFTNDIFFSALDTVR